MLKIVLGKLGKFILSYFVYSQVKPGSSGLATSTLTIWLHTQSIEVQNRHSEKCVILSASEHAQGAKAQTERQRRTRTPEAFAPSSSSPPTQGQP